MEPTFLIVDLFCGAGGTTTGFMQSGVAKVIAAINHDHIAILSHWTNHKDVHHFEEDIRTLQLQPLQNIVRKYQLQYPQAKLILWASLECTNFSKAKGGLAREADSRTLADHLERYITAINPDFVMIENVIEFMDWGPTQVKIKDGLPVMIKNKHGETIHGHEPIKEFKGDDFKRWCQEICNLGYVTEWKLLNSADYGAYTSRPRLFGMFARCKSEIVWPIQTHAKKPKEGLKKWNAIKEKIDFTDEGYSIFNRANNTNIPKRHRKDLSENTFARVYAGCIKHIAGGKEAFMIKYHGGKAKNGVNRNKNMDEPLTVIDTQNRHAACFISKYYSGNPWSKNISVEGPAGRITTIDGQAVVSASFLTQDNGKNHESRNISIDEPARVITTCGGKQNIVNAEFLSIYHGNGDNTHSVEGPAPVLAAADVTAVVKASFLDKQYSGKANHQSIDQPAGVIMGNDKHSLINASFIDRPFTGGGQNSSIENPAGSITSVPKLNLVQAEMNFVDTSQYKNVPTSTKEPLPVIMANRKYPYLVNLQWGGQMKSVNDPAPVILASQNKTPLYLLFAESNEVAITIHEADSEIVKKLKEFMALYSIIDIKMRMLRVDELLQIQGFPKNYSLSGTQSDQKKFIGNSVVPEVVKAWALAMHENIFNPKIKVA